MHYTKQDLMRITGERKEELIHLVSDLVRIKSENPTGSQEEIIAFVMKYLQTRGISCRRVCSDPAFPCVIAEYGKKDGFSLIINGHVDVVPAGDLSKWNFEPYCGTITDKEILGRGTSDMKAGIACALFTIGLFKELNVPIEGNIRLHIVSDEESGGQYGSQYLCENHYADHADACLVAEPTGMDTIEIGQKGGLDLTLRAAGVSAHGSLGNYKGENAILKLAQILPYMQELNRITGHFSDRERIPLEASRRFCREKNGGIPHIEDAIDHVTVNIGMISGGTRPNVVPDQAEAVLDCRLPIGTDHTEIISAVNDIINRTGLAGIEAVYNWKSDANCTDIDAAVVKAFKENGEALLGHEIIPAYQWASSDAKHYRHLGIPTIQFGPSNTIGIHSANETVDIADVADTAVIYTGAICDMMNIR